MIMRLSGHALAAAILAVQLVATAHAQTQLPSTISVPYGPPGEENVYVHHVWRDARSGRALRLVIATSNTPDTVEGSRTYKLWYQVSSDGGTTFDQLRQLVLEGEEFDAFHPIRGVDVRKNGFVTSHAPPFSGSNGEVMVPIELWRLDENGEVYNPAAKSGYTYCDSAVLIGRWNDEGDDLTWDMGDRVQLTLEQSTAGGYEPALTELDKPGTFLIVLRASNFGNPALPSYKWKAISTDYCRTWSRPAPFTYSDGARFYSPASCSEFVRHTQNKRIYWVGNIVEENARGNDPRDPLVIAELDQSTCGLVEESVQVVFTRDPEIDTPRVQFSNASVREDPETHDFVIRTTRIDVGKLKEGESYSGYPFPAIEAIVSVAEEE